MGNFLSAVIVFSLILTSYAYPQGRSVSEIVIFVSPDGNDDFSGNLYRTTADRSDGPLKTITAARNKIRQLKSAGQIRRGVKVYLRGGSYFLDETISLTAKDSGTEKGQIIYSAYRDEKVKLIGGKQVKNFSPVTDPEILNRLKEQARSNVFQADLKAQGIVDYGKILSRGFGRPTFPAALELFFQDRPMTQARWPNTGWLKIDKVPNGKDGGRFTYSEERPGSWKQSDDIWVHGFWTQDWADSYEHVKSIDHATKTVETYPPHGTYGYTANHRFYFLNVLEELDAPGEWYMDRDNGILYFRPTANLDASRAIVSTLDTVLSLDNCSYVSFQNMTIECCRATAVTIKNGSSNSIEGCTIRNIGNIAVLINGGTGNGVTSCDIYETGDGGIRLSGGDRYKLTPAGNYAENNHIHNYSRWCMTYRPAVGVSGVGNRVSHNLIHDGPHNAIQLGGNDHTIEYNEVHHVCNESDDVGAFYSGRSWVNRGTVIKYNFFHDIHSAENAYRHGSRVVYLDDAASGFTISSNVFYKAGSMCAINVGGGRDNIITNNIFIDCKTGAWIDTRGVGWASKHISKGGGWHMYQKLEDVKFNQPPYSTRYPRLASILKEKPAEPRGNVLKNNLAVRTELLNMPENYRHLLEETGNFSTDSNPGFINPEKNDFSLKKDSLVYKKIPGFKEIPFEKIGLYKDKYRTILP